MILYARDAFNVLLGENLQQMKGNKALETSRGSRSSRLRQPPEKLARILKVLDLIPANVALPDLEKQIARLASGKGITQLQRYVRIHELLKLALNETPEEFHQLVWEGGKQGLGEKVKKEIRKFFMRGAPETTRERILHEVLNDDDDVLDEIYFGTIDDAVREYAFLRDSQAKLRRIIGMAKRRNTWLGLLFPVKTSGTITVNADGVVEISNDRFASAVEGVDATLIRDCQNCGRIFWAGRKDKNSCSALCAHVLRNRRYRERYREGFYQGGNVSPREKTASRPGREKTRLKGK